ncbi:hypothetical protein N9B34_00060 [Akkermansiaceae bacterium]|nr:hypothetical protein [Akkermansiaceae bacterium]
MKPKFRDYLTILMALLAIFLCGYGVGFLLGTKKDRKQPAPLILVGRSAEDASSWEESTLLRIVLSLKLTEEQRNLVSNEVQITSEKIQISRDEAFADYYLHLLELHERLLPHLNEQQQEEIKKDQKSLQRAINSRF